MASQAGLGVLQCILLHIQDHKYKVEGDGVHHPLAKVQLALDALRLKATRARGQVDEAELSSVLKLQSMQRGKLARQQTKKLAMEKVNKASKAHER